MIKRRAFSAGVAAFAGYQLLRPSLALAKAAQPSEAVGFKIPSHGCDCHTHIHANPAKYPMSPSRAYTPGEATVQEMAKFHATLGIERVVIVTPSIYGGDNSATISGLKYFGESSRGVAVIDGATTEREMDEMAAMGVRGIRLNLSVAGVSDPAKGQKILSSAFSSIKNRDWHVQVNTSLPMIAAQKEILSNAPTMLVFDHFGGAVAKNGVNQPGFADLVELVRSGRAYVKISIKGGPGNPADFDPLAKALIEANPDRILWGSNWPHPNAAPLKGKTALDETPLWQVDDGRVLNQLAVWAPTEALRKKILVDNPSRLYGFDS